MFIIFMLNRERANKTNEQNKTLVFLDTEMLVTTLAAKLTIKLK